MTGSRNGDAFHGRTCPEHPFEGCRQQDVRGLPPDGNRRNAFEATECRPKIEPALAAGRPERFGAGALLIDFLISSLTYDWQVGGFFLAGLIENCVLLLVFGWLCFRSDRWWLLVVTAAMALEQLRIGRQILLLAFGILFGGIVLTLALAVGLGSKDVVTRSLERQIREPADDRGKLDHV